MYDPFIELVASKKLIPGYKLVKSSKNADPGCEDGMKIKPDISMYKDSVDTANNPTQFDKIETILELKPKKRPSDPFNDPISTLSETERNLFRFEADSFERKECRGQLGSYARTWFSHPYARFIRFDRSGGIVSSRFNFREEGNLLADFFWRFSHLNDIQRGIDDTVSRASEEEAILAKSKLSEWAPKKERDVFKLKVPTGNSSRYFLVWGALADPQSVIGRATRGYPAWDLDGQKVVFLKDSWRSTETGMEKETATLRALNAKGVRNVPKFLCGDDLEGNFQSTITKHYAQPLWNIGAKGDYFIKRAHNRFAEDFIGVQLKNYKSSKQFIQAVHDALIAHQDAYEKCKILHRDISGKNILLTQDGGGILNDWDLAKTVEAIGDGARQQFRSGTWQFMAADLLQHPTKRHTVEDDLELDTLPSIMQSIFEQYIHIPGREPVGGSHKRLMLLTREPIDTLGDGFTVYNNEPVTYLISAFLDLFYIWYSQLAREAFKAHSKTTELKRKKEVVPQAPDTASAMNEAPCNHTNIDDIFREALESDGWPEDDVSLDYMDPALRKQYEVGYAPEAEGSTEPSNASESSPGPSHASRKAENVGSPYVRSSDRIRQSSKQ
ncbi:hypothetical protein CPB84DRAFT_1800893 [Gymnopilus junonius]|uniref:Protein kinase domain-containing protein n=1 Tax=Gymnopilus junonius TaxID=109634 RepID=A0A9P5TFJ8_GYMJU|nr:hypothetical protein CPB84DRAFT_1800893 [Gymnopilus junonius]